MASVPERQRVPGLAELALGSLETTPAGRVVRLLRAKAREIQALHLAVEGAELTLEAPRARMRAVQEAPEILDCYYVAGANDYLIRFAYRDAEDLERFHTDVLMRLPGVERSNSMLVLRTVKKTTALPVGE